MTTPWVPGKTCPCGCKALVDDFPLDETAWKRNEETAWSGAFWAGMMAAEARDTRAAVGESDSYLSPLREVDLRYLKPFLLEHAKRTDAAVFGLLAGASWQLQDGVLVVAVGPDVSKHLRQLAFDVLHQVLSAVRLEDASIAVISTDDALIGRPFQTQVVPAASTTFRVYRLFDAEGTLLYVGKSRCWTKRMRQHERDLEKATWWSDVAEVRLEHCDTEQGMDDAEARAIREENPLYNKVGKNKTLVGA